jgi:trehalose-6-phosphatase
MKKVKIAFDVDDTLITMNEAGENVPRYEIITILSALYTMTDATIIVWSGSGVDWATRWTEKLGISDIVVVIPKGSEEVDIAFDDQEVTLGKVNLQIRS